MWSLREEKVLESTGVFPECDLCGQYHLNLALDLSCIDIMAIRDLYARSSDNGLSFLLMNALLLMV